MIARRFSVDGAELVGHEVRIGDDGKDSTRRAAVYPVGRRLPVYYDPSEPARSVLERGIDVSTVRKGGVALALLALSFEMVRRARRRRAVALGSSAASLVVVIVASSFVVGCERRSHPAPPTHPAAPAPDAGVGRPSADVVRPPAPNDARIGNGAKAFLVCGQELVERDGARLRTARIEGPRPTSLLSVSSTTDEVIGRSPDETTLYWWHGEAVERFSDASSWRCADAKSRTAVALRKNGPDVSVQLLDLVTGARAPIALSAPTVDALASVR